MKGAWRDRVGQWVSLALLAILTTSSWLIAAIVTNNQSSVVSRDGNEISSVVTAALIYRTGPDGDPQQEIRSTRLEQFQDGRSTLLAPEFVQARPEHAVVRVVARQAEISSDQNLIRVQGGVILQRSAFQGSPAIAVQTNNLEYLVDEEIARTADLVRVKRGQSELVGMGMIANQRTGQFSVLADSRMVIPQSPRSEEQKERARRQ